jgi:hypothetical protein
MNKLFIIGLPRTGTTSISIAMLDYNFKVAHTAYTKHAFELADVISDAPCFSDYQQLDKLFPGSKFVYLDRALDNWIPSIQMLLNKMHENLAPKTGIFNPVLKRSFNEAFDLYTKIGSANSRVLNENAFSKDHLTACYLKHKTEAMAYFNQRNDLLVINLSQQGSLSQLLTFLNISHDGKQEFPHVNIGKHVSGWREHKHPNKINALSAGEDHRKFFDYK